ncbi:MAG: hypothetical protein E6H06_04820 [Bacteroidetes bacterium]|nr:MAG: hypothetical protein E6H06_04820 [Bacteroidota bacterium]
MKSDVNSSVLQMNEETFKQLVTEVKETIAIVDLPEPAKRSFGVIDMWNIRRNARSAASMVRL